MLVCLTLLASWRSHGLFSFVTLGVLGAAIYSIPGIVDLERPFFLRGTGGQLFSPTPDDVDAVVAAAWCGLLAGVMVFRPRRQQSIASFQNFDHGLMVRLALASALLASAGLLYLLYTQGTGIIVESRYKQRDDVLLLLWKWTAPLGLLASTLVKSRKLVLFHAFILFLVFLRGDRTLIAITVAAILVAVTRDNPKWYLLLRPSRVIGLGLAAAGVFFGKSIYSGLKAGFSGEGFQFAGRITTERFLFQFEPFATYAHVDFVMRQNLHLRLGTFFEGLFSNLLVIPSYFGLTSNTYGRMIERAAPVRIDSGLAGNYIANGYSLGGMGGAIFFYFLLAWILRQCDARFNKSEGAWKLFWCCTGATFAFYAHRNGLDNIVSFMRQFAIVCLALAITSVILSPLAKQKLNLDRFSRDTVRSTSKPAH